MAVDVMSIAASSRRARPKLSILATIIVALAGLFLSGKAGATVVALRGLLGDPCVPEFSGSPLVQKPPVDITNADLSDPMVWSQAVQSINRFDVFGERIFNRPAYIQFALRTLDTSLARNHSSLESPDLLGIQTTAQLAEARIRQTAQALLSTPVQDEAAFMTFYVSFLYYAAFSANVSAYSLARSAGSEKIRDYLSRLGTSIEQVLQLTVDRTALPPTERFGLPDLIRELYDFGPVTPMITHGLLDNTDHAVETKEYLLSFILSQALLVMSSPHFENNRVYDPVEAMLHEIRDHSRVMISAVKSVLAEARIDLQRPQSRNLRDITTYLNPHVANPQAFALSKFTMFRFMVAQKLSGYALHHAADSENSLFGADYYQLLIESLIVRVDPSSGAMQWQLADARAIRDRYREIYPPRAPIANVQFEPATPWRDDLATAIANAREDIVVLAIRNRTR